MNKNPKQTAKNYDLTMQKVFTKKYIAQAFRAKDLMLSSKEPVLQLIISHLTNKLEHLLDKIVLSATEANRTIINLNLLEYALNTKYEELVVDLPPRIFSGKYMAVCIREKGKMVSNMEPVLPMLKKVLFKKLLLLVEKSAYACKISKKVIITKDLMNLALEMADGNETT